MSIAPLEPRQVVVFQQHHREELMHRVLIGAVLLGVSGFFTPAAAQIRIDLNIPALKLVVYEGDELLETYPIAVGLPEFPTPTGNFEITHAEWNPWWNPPTHREWAKDEQRTAPGPTNPMGRVKLFFLPLYFIHGTPAGESIGTPASHGCVRMRNEDVVALARLLHQKAAPHVSAAKLTQLTARWGSTERVNFRSDIALTVRYDPVVVERGEIFVYPDIYERRAIHSEAVYQALLAAGYDVTNLEPAEVRSYIERVKGQKAPVVTKVDDAFRSRVPLATAG